MISYLVTFFTHHDAIEYLRFLRGRNMKGTLRPVPRSVSSSCGTCAIFQCPDVLAHPDEYLYEGCEGLYQIREKIYIPILSLE